MKTISIITLGIFLFSFTSITAIYSGDNYTFSIDTTENLLWSSVGNSSNMNGFNVYQEIYNDYSNITFTTELGMKPDNFTIILFNIEEEIVNVYHSGSSGGTKYIDRNVTTYLPGLTRIEYVDRNITTQIDDSDEPEVEEDNFNWQPIVSGFVIFILLLTLYFLNKRKNITEGRLKDEI